MYRVVASTRFRRDIKRIQKRGKDHSKLRHILHLLEQGTALPPKNRDHALSSNWQGYRECHIEPDWLLIYRIDNDASELHLIRTGSHADLFS
ncbi:MAG: type II toxin-antitoxin system YafQ family toxin [Chloroflexota bacterium]